MKNPIHTRSLKVFGVVSTAFFVYSSSGTSASREDGGGDASSTGVGSGSEVEAGPFDTWETFWRFTTFSLAILVLIGMFEVLSSFL